MAENLSQVMGIIVGGHPGAGPQDPLQIGSLVVNDVLSGPSSFSQMCLNPISLLATGNQGFPSIPDPGKCVNFQMGHGLGAMHGTITGMQDLYPMPASGIGGTSSVSSMFQMAAFNPVNAPLMMTKDTKKRADTTAGGLQNFRGQDMPYIPSQRQASPNKPYWGQFEIDSWEEKNSVQTAKSSFGGGLLSSMLSSLPGMVMSLAQSFSGLSSQQKKKIKANTTPEIYSMIETAFSSTTDIGDFHSVSLNNRVHKETFQNHLVEDLCKCKQYSDVVNVMHELRANTKKHGKDKLPTVKFPRESAFGTINLVVDAYGEIVMDIPEETKKSRQAFSDMVTSNISSYNAIASFEGDVEGTTLKVNVINYGTIKIGEQYLLDGSGVVEGTYIVKRITGKGGTGTYKLNQEGKTPHANTPLLLYTVTQPKNQEPAAGAGGGGLGGLGGAIPGMNMFGYASQLISQAVQTMDPGGAAAVNQVLGAIQGGSILQQIHADTFLSSIFPFSKFGL